MTMNEAPTMPGWFKGIAVDQPKNLWRFHTTDTFPLVYHPIPKCACTFVKSILYRLNHNLDPTADVPKVGLDQGIAKTNNIPIEALKTATSFAVLRHPMDRLTSLYYDKVFDFGPNPHPLRNRLNRVANLTLRPDIDDETHAENILKIVGWLKGNLSGHAKDINPHWQRQSYFLQKSGFLLLDPVLMTVPDLSNQLKITLKNVVPNIAAYVDAGYNKNTSARHANAQIIGGEEILDGVKEIYSQDLDLFNRAAARWST